MGMSEPVTAPGQPGDARELTAHVSAVRTQVRRDLRATSFPRGGVGRPAGFGAAAVVGLCFTMSLGLIAMAFAGPFLVFGLGLLVAGIWQRNRFLVWWAVLIGGIGVFEGFYGFTNRLPSSAWREWDHPAIYLVLALLTVLAGLIARRQENRTR
jgi:hypothetical protein